MITAWFFAPPSACTRLPWDVPVEKMYFAIGVEPTKLTACTPGCASSASTASLSPLTTLNTPSGRPASLSSVARISDADGSRSEGLRTKVFPQTIAIGNIHSGTIAGKLKGVMPATTPSGWRSVYASMPELTFSVNSLLRSCGAPHAYSTMSMPRASSPAASDKHLAVLARDRRDDLVGALFEQRLEAEHHAGTGERSGRRPSRERRLRGVDRAADFGGARERHACAERAGRGRVDVAEAARGAGRALASDPVGERGHVGLAQGGGGSHGGLY